MEGLTNSANENAANFVTDDARIDANIDIEIPLQVSLRNVTHTIDFDIDGKMNLSDVDSIELRLVTLNELPFNATLDVYILGDTLDTGVADSDTLYHVLDKIALNQPFLNIDRTVREPKIAIEDIPLDKTDTSELIRGEIIRVLITMNSPISQTSEDDFVKLLSTAKLEVTLGMRGKLNSKL